MARQSLVFAMVGLVAGLAQPPVTALSTGTPITHIDRAMHLLLGPTPGGDCKEGFLSLLDALVAVAHDAPSAAACRPQLVEARARLARRSVLDPGVDALIRECYRDVHKGAPFRVPHGVNTMSEATAYCRTTLESAKALLRTGAGSDEAFDRILDVTVLIVTPMERGAGKVESLIWLVGARWWAAVQSWFLEGLGWLSTERSSLSG